MTSAISLINFDIEKDISINFPLAYLHGIVQSREGTIIVCKNISIPSQESIQWPVKDGEFKVFVYLKEGSNEISLDIDEETEVRIKMNYVKESNSRYVLPIYLICKSSDGSFIAPCGVSNSAEDAVAKIKLNARLMQTFFAESLYEHGFSRRTFCLAEDDDNELVVKVVQSQLDIEKTKDMTPGDLYDAFKIELQDILPKDVCRKLLCFMSCTRYCPPEDEEEISIKNIFSYASGHAALGGGDMALFGTGSFHTWASHLNELTEKFSDTTKIDRKKLFDDSCGRGSYMENYSTTLGATVHELGHSFDLAHTAHGIMCRGHDDMNYFYTIVKPYKNEMKEVTDPNVCRVLDDSGKYQGAHWYRSSAVILNYHKWFNRNKHSSKDNCMITKSLHQDMLGPFGNAGWWCQKDQESFNSQSWLNERELNLTGVVFYHEKYLNGIQFLGAKFEYKDGLLDSVGKEESSKIFGTAPEGAEKTTFRFEDPNEKIVTIRMRSGAYIDGIEIVTTTKCSGWLGGQGGDFVEFNVTSDRSIEGCVGTSGDVIGSLGFILNRSSAHVGSNENNDSSITFSSENGIRLVESHDHIGEVQYFKEFLDDPPPLRIHVPVKDLLGREQEKVDGLVLDNAGEKLLYSLNKSELEMLSQLE